MLELLRSDANHHLQSRERQVVRLHFGLDRGQERTLTEVANVLGVSSVALPVCQLAELGLLLAVSLVVPRWSIRRA
jgi:DNA-directed RNA polymerase specialized sigma subunit